MALPGRDVGRAASREGLPCTHCASLSRAEKVRWMWLSSALKGEEEWTSEKRSACSWEAAGYICKHNWVLCPVLPLGRSGTSADEALNSVPPICKGARRLRDTCGRRSEQALLALLAAVVMGLRSPMEKLEIRVSARWRDPRSILPTACFRGKREETVNGQRAN